jgi:hypothetical protein
MTSRRKELGYTRSIEPRFGQPKSRPKTRATSSDNDGIVFVVLHHEISGLKRHSISGPEHTMTGYFCVTKGEASFARSGWFAIIRADQSMY